MHVCNYYERDAFAVHTTEPPTIPVVLAKSAFVAVDPPVEKMPPNILRENFPASCTKLGNLQHRCRSFGSCA